MTALLTLAVAKRHLRVDHDDDDEDIQDKIEQASAIVLNYIKRTIGTVDPDEPDPGIVDWDDTTVPKDIKAGVQMMLEDLYDNRMAGSSDNPNIAMGYLPPRVTAILHRWRDPTMA
jgi:uncharacterized phage protein (predicted DNA packaging)